MNLTRISFSLLSIFFRFLLPFIYKPIKKRIEQVLEKSNNNYWRNKFNFSWITINNYVAIDFFLNNIFSNDLKPESIIFIKNISDHLIEEINIKINTVSFATCTRTEKIELTNVKPNILYEEPLIKIPLQSILFTEDNKIICSHSSLQVTITSLIIEGQRIADCRGQIVD